MTIIRKPSYADATGDAIPFFNDEIYHIFSLTPPSRTTVYPERLRTSWSHMTSTDLVHWKELPTALTPGNSVDDPDYSGVWTGSVICSNGVYHAFYTGYNIQARFQQTICHATSPDGICWTKDPRNPVLVPLTDYFEPQDWRDPYIFFNEDDHLFWLLVSARKKSYAENRKGCIVLFRSADLQNWNYYGALYFPGNTNCPECSEMYKMGDTWFLSYSRFSEFVNTVYRTSSSPFGPWRTPREDGIGGRRFYAAKSTENSAGRRFYFGWAHDRAGESDQGEWYWGGAWCIPHEVSGSAEGELDVKLPAEIETAIDTPVSWDFMEKQGNVDRPEAGAVRLHTPGSTNFGFFTVTQKSFLFRTEVTVLDAADTFGILLKSDDEACSCLFLAFDIAMQRVSLLNLPMAVDPFWQQSCQAIPQPKEPGPDGFRVCEKPFHFGIHDKFEIKTITDKDMLEIFVNDKIAFTYRSYARCTHEIGLIVQDGDILFANIEFRR